MFDQITGERFLQQCFENNARRNNFTDELEAVLLSEFSDFCRRLDATQLQESWLWRNCFIARKLSLLLIDPDGKLNKARLERALVLLEKGAFSLGINRYQDRARIDHQMRILRLFASEIDYVRSLNHIRLPLGNKEAHSLIYETLDLQTAVRLSDVHARQAALSCMLCSLRQNVGSCFATAPAIQIAEDLPLRQLKDIEELFDRGRLTRIVEGVQYSVPLSASWGLGSLLLKVDLAQFEEDPFEALSFSPGLCAAFIAAGVIEEGLSEEKVQSACATLLRKGLRPSKEAYRSVTSADQLIKATLLTHFDITLDEVYEYQKRAQQMVRSGGILGMVPHAPVGKSARCSRFLQTYTQAVKAFNALTENPLLKAWEFTLASLSESKSQVTKGNLFISLGVNPEDLGGIGRILQEAIEEKIRKLNQDIEAQHVQYDHLFAQVKYLEGKMARGSTEQEVRWAQAEYQISRHDIDRVLRTRDAYYDKGRKLQAIYPKLIELFVDKVKDYFQEVYDPKMVELVETPFDDSPAGFRLLYKHGRPNSSLWSAVTTADEYINYLSAFLIAMENELCLLPQFEGVHKEIGECIALAIQTIREPQFLELACVRLAQAYNEPMIARPLENINLIARKPWAYISGGTMSSLMSCYWQLVEPPQEEKKWVESPGELLAFFIDSMKGCPLRVQSLFLSGKKTRMLGYSPTHAFSILPAMERFKEAWQSDLYTYTWIRDHFVISHKAFLDEIILDARMMDSLIVRFLQVFPKGSRFFVRKALNDFNYSMTPFTFRDRVLKALFYEKHLSIQESVQDELDALLHSHLPLFPEFLLEERLNTLFDLIEELDATLKDSLRQQSAQLQEKIARLHMFSAQDLLSFAKGLLIECMHTTRAAHFFHGLLVHAMRKLHFCYPEPLIFADTNWVNNTFGFIVNPGNQELELWRFDEQGTKGRAMSVWRRYINGEIQEPWGLFIAPHQYGS